jgi:hypothetical protein
VTLLESGDRLRDLVVVYRLPCGLPQISRRLQPVAEGADPGALVAPLEPGDFCDRAPSALGLELAVIRQHLEQLLVLLLAGPERRNHVVEVVLR